FEQGGSEILLQLIALPDVFPEEVELVGAAILSQLTSQDELRKLTGAVGIPSLIRLMKTLPENEALQLVVIKAFKSLCVDGEMRYRLIIDMNKQTIFEEGGVHLLKNLLISPHEEVLVTV